MRWIEFQVDADREAAETIAELFNRHGQGGVAIEEQVEGHADRDGFQLTGDTVRISTYLPEGADAEPVRDSLERALWHIRQIRPVSDLRVRMVDEADWANAWKEHFHVHRVGQRTVIRPTWRDYQPAPNDIVLDLDPGMAFGTGSHPTTALCLRALEDRVTPGCVVYDVGTGSGILAIAAVKLGASRVEACDVDPVAVRVAQANAAQNGVGARVRITRGDWTSLPPGEADLVVANIIADVVIELAAGVHRLGRPGALFIASGVIAHRVDDVVGAFREAGLSAIEIEREGEWAAIIARLRGAAT